MVHNEWKLLQRKKLPNENQLWLVAIIAFKEDTSADVVRLSTWSVRPPASHRVMRKTRDESSVKKNLNH